MKAKHLSKANDWLASLDNKSNTRFLHSYMKEHKYAIFFAYLCTLLLAFLSAIIASSIGPSLEVFLSQTQKQYEISKLVGESFAWIVFNIFHIKHIESSMLLSILPFFLIVISGTKALLLFTQSYIWESLGEKISKELRNDLFKSYILDSPYKRFYSQDKEQIDSRFSSIITSDLKLLKEYIVHFWGAAPREILQSIFLTFTLLLISTKLCLIFFLFLAPAFFIIRTLGKRLKRRTYKALDSYSFLSEWLQQRLLGIETIKQYKTEDIESKKFSEENEKLFQRLLKAFLTKAQAAPIIEFFSIAAISLILFYSILKIADLSITGSIAISFFSTTALLGQSLSTIGRHLNTSKEGSSATSRIKDTFIKTSGKHLSHFPKITFSNLKSRYLLSCNNLSIKYPSLNTNVINDFSYNFEAGKTYCITGPSGSGKSSFIKAILGLVPSTKDAISFFPPIYSQKDIGYLPQNILLAPSSVAMNISYPYKEPNMQKVEDSLRSVDLLHTINKLPQRTHTIIGSYNKNILSGGQNQRILFARLLYHSFPLILIDEGTSALDHKTRKILYSCLTHLQKKHKTTIIMVSHQHSDLQIADHEIKIDSKT